jgi:hypothetical protein
METVDEIKTLIEATVKLTAAFNGLARKLNYERLKIGRNGVYPSEDLSALHAKLWTLRSAVDVLKGEVLSAKAPGTHGVFEEQREKRLQEWRRSEQVRKHWHDATPVRPGKIESSGPQIER